MLLLKQTSNKNRRQMLNKHAHVGLHKHETLSKHIETLPL